MSLTYPLTLPDVGLKCTAFGFSIPKQTSPTNGGKTQIVEYGDAIWQAKYETPVLFGANFALMTAWERAMQKAKASCLAWDTRSRYPRAYNGVGWDGLTLASNSSTAFTGTCTLASIDDDGFGMTLSGLPAGFVLTPGDGLSFLWNTSCYAYHSVADLSAVTADDDGKITISTDPVTLSGYASGVTVTLEAPTFWGHVTSWQKSERSDGKSGNWAFTVTQSPEQSA